MAILTLAFSMFLGFIGGYFAARITVDRVMFSNNKIVKSISEAQYETSHDIIGIKGKIEGLEQSLVSLGNACAVDGDTWNSNFGNVKEFMKQQVALNAKVDQAIRVLQTFGTNPYQDSEEEVLYNGPTAESSEEEA